MDLIDVTINNITVSVPQGSTVLEAARQAGIHIPTLCHIDMQDFHLHNEPSSCRVCLVEVASTGKLVTACSETATDGMVIRKLW